MDARLRRCLREVGVACLLAVATACATTGGAPRGGAPTVEPDTPPLTLDAPPKLVVEAIVVDKKGAPVEGLRARDFAVSIDGRRRAGMAIARLYRGPGANLLAASRTATTPGEVLPIPEPSRTVVAILDQASFFPGDETRAREVVNSCLALLGLSDRIAVVSLPARPGAAAISFDRAAIRQTLANLRALGALGAEALNIEAADARSTADVRAAVDDAPRPVGGGAAGSARADANPERPTGPPGAIPALDDPRPAGGAGGRETVSPAVSRAHAISTLSGLRQVLQVLGMAPGAKTVLFISSGLVATDAASLAQAVVEDAARAQARIFVLQVPSSSRFGEAGARDLHLLAQETGGRLVPLTSKPEQALERLAGQLAFSYLLLLAPMPGDSDPVSHALQVTLPTRPDLTVQAARRVAPGRLAPNALVKALSPRASPPPAAVGDTPRSSASPPAQHDSSLDLLLDRVSQYVWDYGRELSSVVSEETYTQEVHGGSGTTVILNGTPAGGAAKSRQLVSDFLLVKIPGLDGWLPFRDVFEVDGQRVRDRQDRLVKLFLQSAPDVALESANEIWRESARYNIGPIRRDLNVPTLPLWFLEPESRHRFSFRRAGEQTLAGQRVSVLEFTETAHPTFIKTSGGEDVPASGKLWVEPANGRILRTVLKASVATITVTYAPREELPGLWLPVMMEEKYAAGNLAIKGTATYARFRQFQVSTTEQIVLPKK